MQKKKKSDKPQADINFVKSECERRAKLASYLYDVSKIFIGTVVIGAAFLYVADTSKPFYVDVILFGVFASVLTAFLANFLYKYNSYELWNVALTKS